MTLRALRHRGLLCSIFAAAFLFSVLLQASATPRLKVDEPVWNFGTLTNRPEVTHTFTLRNLGGTDLEISRVVSGCDTCLRTVLERERIEPGGSSLLHCRLDLRSLDGSVTRMLAVHSNDPDRPVLELGMTGVTVLSYLVTPVELVLDLTQGQQTAIAEIIPLQNLRAPLSRVTGADTNLVATLAAAGTNRFQLTVRALPSLPRGRKLVNLVISSSDTNDPPCRVTVAVHNPADFELMPARLQFQPLAAPQMRILWVKQHGTSPLTLLDVIPSSDKFRCEIDPEPASQDYRIYITAWDQEVVSGQAGTLTLKLRDARQQERMVSVPVSVEQGDGERP
jgi:hypothetical protein